MRRLLATYLDLSLESFNAPGFILMRLCRTCLVLAAAFVIVASEAFGQQQADPDFDTRVAHPAYTKEHPRVLFDEAHHNFHTAGGRYKPFADLIGNDGCIVVRNNNKLLYNNLQYYDILIIVNALGRGADG